MQLTMRWSASTALVLLFAPTPAHAEAAGAHAHHSHAAISLGGVHVDGATGASIGADVATRFAAHVAIVALIDVARVHATTHLLAATGIAVYPWRRLSVTAAVGWEHAPGHDALALRAAAGYAVPLGPTTVGPTVAIDRAGGATAVVGAMAVGVGF